MGYLVNPKEDVQYPHPDPHPHPLGIFKQMSFFQSKLCWHQFKTHCGLMMPYGDMDLSLGLLPDDTKPLPQPMLTYYQ